MKLEQHQFINISNWVGFSWRNKIDVKGSEWDSKRMQTLLLKGQMETSIEYIKKLKQFL